MEQRQIAPSWLLPGLFFASRFFVFLSVFHLGPDAFGDQSEYFSIASLQGWPFFNYWVEYPPVFAFVNELIYEGVSGQQGYFFLAFTLLLGLAGAVFLYFFQRSAGQIYGLEQGFVRTVVITVILFLTPYTYWHYDLLPLACLMAGIWWVSDAAPVRAGMALGLGMLVKWFPGVALAAVLRFRPRRDFLRTAVISLGMVLLVLGVLLLLSPEMTRASLLSQPNRTSWQTVWAYLDGNRVTGHFVYSDFRYNIEQAYLQRGNPARFPTTLTLAAFLAAGLFFFWRVRNLGARSLAAFVGITIVIFFMWSPGWSPQWILYVLPIILLTLPLGQGLLMSLTLLLITLFEFPVAINQYWFRAVFAMAGLRMLAFALLVFLWYRITRRVD